MTIEQQIAIGALVAAFAVPAITLYVQSRAQGRASFQSEAMARIQMLRDQLNDCLDSKRPISGGDGGTSPTIPMTPRSKDES